ncbi:MAG: PAS domain S-box protein, partial [Methanospirillum sp.]|nr:PAS domain S-box protein [Methanospirillum sp.]
MISILYVDDESDLLTVARIFLERSGEFKVCTMTSAQQALDSPSIQIFDAIISDYLMPGMDGIAFLKQVREKHGDIPFILFTGRGREEIIIDAINNGADFYLQKGGDPQVQFAELAHKIRQAVRRRRAEQALHDSEKRLSDIVNFLPDATFAIDRDGTVILWNRAIERMTGIPSETMMGKTDYEYALPFYGFRRPILIDLMNEPDEKISEYYSTIYRDEDSLTAETDLPHPKGTRIHVLAKVCPLYSSFGDIIGAIESIRDITERRHSEEVLRESEEKYRTLIENIRDIVYIIRDEKLLVINKQATELFGYTMEELQEMSPSLLLHPDDHEKVRLANQQLKSGEVALSRFTARTLTKSGEVRHFEFTESIITYRGEMVTLGIGHDVTRRVLNEQRLFHKSRTLSIINQIIQSSNQLDNIDELLRIVMSATLDLLCYD